MGLAVFAHAGRSWCIAAAVVAFLASTPASLAAQVNVSYLTSPRGYLQTHGFGSTDVLGRYPDMRIQHADNELRGKFLFVKSFDFRVHTPSQPTSMWGRTWSSVTLRMSEIDISTMTATWARNIQTTPTTMFEGSMSWPSLQPSAAGEPWGAHVSFPFRGYWFYTGKQAMLSDYVFTGGGLDRKTVPDFVNWSNTSPLPYPLDGVASPAVSFQVAESVPATGPACTESPADGNDRARAFADVTITRAFRPFQPHPMAVRFGSFGTAPGQLVVHVVGVAGFPDGVSIGALCNKLHVDLNQPFVMLTNIASRSSESILGFETVWDKSMAENKVWFQSAWQHSRLGSPALTVAASLACTPPGFLQKWTVFSKGPATQVGEGPFADDHLQLLYRIAYR